jgi:hypothetical protein
MVINFNTAVNQSALTGGFLNQRNDNSSQAQILLDQGRERQTITGQTLGDNDTGALNNLVSFSDYLSGGFNNPQSTFRNTHASLSGLGQASLDISEALAHQVNIRENQRFADNTTMAEINARLSGNVESLGKSILNLSDSKSAESENSEGGFFDGFGFPALPTFNDLKKPLLIAGIGLLALMVVPRLIKGGFKK